MKDLQIGQSRTWPTLQHPFHLFVSAPVFVAVKTAIKSGCCLQSLLCGKKEIAVFIEQ